MSNHIDLDDETVEASSESSQGQVAIDRFNHVSHNIMTFNEN
jgi:hypothetical protein